MSKGVIKAIPFSKENFYSRLFLVPKKEGTYRPVIDLSRLNRFVENFHFQMENVSCLKTFVRPKGCISLCPRTQFLTKVPVFPVEKQLSWLPRAVIWAKCLSQGIYKLIKLIAAYLRKRGIRIIVDLDDFLILGSSIKESKANTQLTLDLLQWLGVTINWEKSMEVPTQSLTFLGLSIDSQTMSLSLPERKILNKQSKCQSLIRNPTSSARQVARLIGTLEAVCSAIWQAPSTLQRITHTAHKIPTGLSRQLRDTHVPTQQCSQRTSEVAPEHSNRKQRYHQSSCPRAIHNLRCLQNLTANGCWFSLEARDHINVFELNAAFLATKTFLKDRSNITVRLRMDNSTAVAHVNNKGGTFSPQLVDLTLELWEWCLQKSILITAQHLPGKLNNVAVRESRVLRLQRMANRPPSDSALPKKVQCRSLCVTPNGSPPNLCQHHARVLPTQMQ